MEENLAWLVAVVTAHLAHTILSRTIRAQHDVPLLNSLETVHKGPHASPAPILLLSGCVAK
jgi:hypothetical protein